MTRLPISVCIISGAEASRIGRALTSVADWTSEIVVVLNQEVADGTDEIARQHGAMVFREPWKGYLAQKNSAADKATQPWLLNLDADEAVSPELKTELVELFASPAQLERFAAYNFPRRSWFCGRWILHGDWYPDRLTRLWRRGRARWGGVDTHTSLVVEGAVGRLKHDVLHFSSESIANRIQKIAHFSDEFVRLNEAGGRVPGLFDLALRPFWRFFRGYVIKRGFLDGWAGFYIASHMAFATLVRYARLRETRLPKTTP
jgi:glycosyltransferase involved in cell wall biosynthesis